MRHELLLHPDSPCEALTGVEVEVWRTIRAGGLVVRFTVRGQVSEVLLPPLRHWQRADDLRKTTCFEAFLRATPESAYYEFNFSPSTEWAVYRFAGYREGKSVPAGVIPQTEQARSREYFELRAYLDLGALHDLPADRGWQLGLSAVIEETNGRKSYWALVHPLGKPDFHHPDCFALELPPPSPAR